MARSALVLGAGVAGLACATELARAGLAVTLIDKGRRPGGRVATRRADGTSFNHGAQFVTARGRDFQALLAALKATPWPAAGPRRSVFLPNMSALPAAMAEQATVAGTTILLERQAAFLHPDRTVRHLPAAAIRPGATTDTGGELTAPHDVILLALPSDQSAILLGTAGHPFAAIAATAVTAPCWAVMVRFQDPVAGPDVIQPGDNPIGWAARENARPGRPPKPEAWTLHASVAWSRTNLELPPDVAGARLLAAFQALTGAGEPDLLQAHRWRHALVETPVGQPCLWDAETGIGACGDWCLGGRIEAAYDSGLALARAVLKA